MEILKIFMTVASFFIGLSKCQMIEDLINANVKQSLILINELSTKVDELLKTTEEQTCMCSQEISEIKEILTKDECADLNPCDVNAVCRNTLVGYKCTCNSGFTGDGHSCQDIDECIKGDHYCHRYAKCTNTVGGYNCTCQKPFKGNGQSCENPPCDLPARLIDGLGCVYPMTARTTWEEARINCHNQGFVLLQAIVSTAQLDVLRKYFDSYFDFPNQYHDVWLGIKQAKWIGKESLNIPQGFWDGNFPRGLVDDCGYMALQTTSYLWETVCEKKIPSFCQFLEN